MEAGGLGPGKLPEMQLERGRRTGTKGAQGQGSMEDCVFLLGEALGLGWIPTEKALHGLLHRPQQSAHGLTKSPFTGNSVVTWKNAYPGSFEAGGEEGSRF